MDFTYLGKSGLRVSRICLGTMDFGGGMDEATARQVVDAAREAQVNFIDTADAYTKGASETILGKLIEEDRNNWVLATKVGQQDGPPRSLKRLPTSTCGAGLTESGRSTMTFEAATTEIARKLFRGVTLRTCWNGIGVAQPQSEALTKK